VSRRGLGCRCVDRRIRGEGGRDPENEFRKTNRSGLAVSAIGFGCFIGGLVRLLVAGEFNAD